MRIKPMVLALFFTLGSENIQALKLQSEGKSPADLNSTAEQKPQSVKDNEGNKQKPSRPAPGFTPTEKIQADSAVSFPVDI